MGDREITQGVGEAGLECKASCFKARALPTHSVVRRPHSPYAGEETNAV